MKKSFTLTFIFLMLYPLLACINSFQKDENGEAYEYHNESVIPFKTAFDYEDVHKEYLKLKKENTRLFPSEKTELAINALKLGHFEEALAIFKELTEKEPNEYRNNANLGTTYELLGENEKALKYIKRGLELNPDSHRGSEWIHVKILEAKIKQAKNPNWLATHSILGIDANKYKGIKHQNKYNEDFEKVIQFIENIDYQLHTRVAFTPAPDLITEKLFTELADLCSAALSVEFAYVYYSLAYYYSNEKNVALKQKIHDSFMLFKKYYKNEPHIPQIEGIFPTQNRIWVNNRVFHWEDKLKSQQQTKVPIPARKINKGEPISESKNMFIWILGGIAFTTLGLGIWFAYFKRKF